MFTGKTVFAQLVSLIPLRDFNICVARYKGDYRSRNLSCYDQFLVMCLAQYASKNSLRDIEASLIAVEHKLYHSGISYAVPRNTLAKANEQRDWLFVLRSASAQFSLAATYTVHASASLSPKDHSL